MVRDRSPWCSGLRVGTKEGRSSLNSSRIPIVALCSCFIPFRGVHFAECGRTYMYGHLIGIHLAIQHGETRNMTPLTGGLITRR